MYPSSISHSNSLPSSFTETSQSDYLVVCILQNDETMVGNILKQGVNLNQLTHLQYPPLSYALHKKNYSILKLLLEHKADPNARYENTRPIITDLFIEKNKLSEADVNIILLFLEYGLDPNSLCKITGYTQELTLFSLLSLTENITLLKTCIAKGALLNPAKQDPLLFFAIALKNKILVKFFLEMKACPNACDTEGVPLLMHAIHTQQTDLVELLLCYGANPQTLYHGRPILEYIHSPLIKEMCLKYVLPQKNDKEPTARISDIWEITREKTCHFSHLVKQKGERATLCESAYMQDLPAMQKLIIKGGSPNTQDHQGNSLLHLSIQKVLEYYKTGTKKSTHQQLLDQGIGCIQFLLESKANPQILNHKKLTVHEIAAQSGDVLATQRVANLIRYHRQNNSLEGKMEKLHLN